MSIPRIHHAALVVPDLAAAVQFYCEFLAMDISFRTSWTAPSPEIDQLVGVSGSSADVVMLKGAEFRLELFQYRTPQHSDVDPGGLDAHELGLRHLAILVDDVVSELDRLIALGGSKINDPVQIGAGMSVYCRDPFGTIIELLS